MNAYAPLPPRQLEVLRLVAAGYDNRMIADRLSITRNTVKEYLSRIMTRLEVTDRSAAVAVGFREGWLT